MMSTWLLAPNAAATPSTAIVCDRTTVGAMGQRNASGSGTNYLAQTHIGCTSSGVWILADRLCQQGGLDTTSSSPQTVNLPTPTLTRYTDGVGVMMGLELHGTNGATQTTINVDYTNQDGTSGQTSASILFGGTGYRESARFLPIGLASGDYGVRSIESYTQAGTAGGAGACGLVLYRPLLYLPIDMANNMSLTFDSFLHLGMLPKIEDDACLWWLFVPGNSSTATGTLTVSSRIAEAQ